MVSGWQCDPRVLGTEQRLVAGLPGAPHLLPPLLGAFLEELPLAGPLGKWGWTGSLSRTFC